MAAYAPGPMEGDKEGCKSIIVKQGKLALQVATAVALVLVAIFLASCSSCDPSKKPCDTDLSTRNKRQYNAPVDKDWCIWGSEAVPCTKGD